MDRELKDPIFFFFLIICFSKISPRFLGYQTCYKFGSFSVLLIDTVKFEFWIWVLIGFVLFDWTQILALCLVSEIFFWELLLWMVREKWNV